jgi:glycosyltransferase involved in cell wall biosynthesis
VTTAHPPAGHPVGPIRHVVVIRPDQGGIAYVAGATVVELRARGTDVTELVGDDEGSPALDGLRTVWRNRDRIRAADVVHVELGRTALAAFWIGIWASLLRGDLVTVLHDGPTVVTAPGSGVIHTRPGRRDAVAHKLFAPVLDRPLRQLLQRRTRCWVALSDRSRSDLASAGLAPVVVIPLGADPPGATRPPSEGDSVVFAGFIAQSKGIDTLLDAWEEVGPTTGLRLHILGGHRRQYDGYVAGLRARVEASGTDVTWHGRVDDGELDATISGAAIVVLPYLTSNPVSGILVRALVAGRPVVATSVPAFVDMVEDGVTGVIVEPGDVPGLAKAIAGLAHDAPARDELGGAAAAWAARHCTWTAQVDALETAYRTGADRRGRSPAVGPTG